MIYHERRAVTQHLQSRHCLSLAEDHRLYGGLVGGDTVHRGLRPGAGRHQGENNCKQKNNNLKETDTVEDLARTKKQRVDEPPMEPLILCCPFSSCQFAISPKVKAVSGIRKYQI